MSNYHYAYWDALQTIVEARLPYMAGSHILFRAAQANELNWSNIIEQYSINAAAGVNLPFGVTAYGQANPDDFGGMHGATVRIPTSIYYVRRKTPHSTTVTQAATSATQTVGDTAWMVPGTPLKFVTAGVVRIVDHVVSATSVVLTASVTATFAEVVKEVSVETATEAVMAYLRDGIVGHSGGVFQATDVPSIDCSDSNPANMSIQKQQAPLYAGVLTFPALVGETFASVT